ncbi:MAG: ATP-binding protein, partial [Chloroflexi bacterium]|nr:ATP-binding protein [Chloroflexota bacterium]
MATGLAQAEGVRLLVDVGTNGEIILCSLARTVATAAPAGPAFEGAQIQSGMRASDGAIEAVTITLDAVQLQVIGDVPPVGLCGSGLLDAVAQLRLVGLLAANGRFLKSDAAAKQVSPELAERLITDDAGRRAFVLAWEHESGNGRLITLTQRDIRELQFAKAAIASGIEAMMTELDVTQEDLEEIYLAGSFGNYINPQSARIIGLVPPVPVERIKAVGNASGEGAKMALLSFRERQIAHSLPQIIEYHELSSRADFNDAFISILQFPELANL